MEWVGVKMSAKPESIKVSEIFESEYLIPIYQRNYAWGQKEIEQLLDDIRDSECDYYLGNLIVNKRDGVFEVIDGQQRLTTLFLLGIYLELPLKNTLKFEARKNSNRILKYLEEKDLKKKALK